MSLARSSGICRRASRMSTDRLASNAHRRNTVIRAQHSAPSQARTRGEKKWVTRRTGEVERECSLMYRGSPGSSQPQSRSEENCAISARFQRLFFARHGGPSTPKAVRAMRRIAAVIFDMDGVLVDSEPLHYRATRAALGARG